MDYFEGTTDALQLLRGTAAAIDVKVSWVEINKTTQAPVSMGTTPNSFTSVNTDTIMSAAGSGNIRTVKQMTIVNKDASLSCPMQLILDRSATDYVIYPFTLNAGDVLFYTEGLGFFISKPNTTRSGLKNGSTADQSLTASSANYITGSSILLPASNQLVAGMQLRWNLVLEKTAAGTAATTWDIRFGTAGTTGDTSRCSSAMAVETNVADFAHIVVLATIRGPIGASCIVDSLVQIVNNASFTTGFKTQNKRTLSSAFDITPAGTIVGLSATPGASNVTTVHQCSAELLFTGG